MVKDLPEVSRQKWSQVLSQISSGCVQPIQQDWCPKRSVQRTCKFFINTLLYTNVAAQICTPSTAKLASENKLPYRYPPLCSQLADSQCATCKMLRLQFVATLGGCHFEIPIMSTLAMQIAYACTFITCQIMKPGQVQYASHSVLIGTPLLHYWLVHCISKRLHPSQP